MSLLKYILKENYGGFKYYSDYLRYSYLEDIVNISQNSEPNFKKLLDSFDGYDDLIYIQKINDNEYIYWEGWNRECWKGAYKKPEYKYKTKEEILELFVNDRFKNILNKLNYSLVDYEHVRYKKSYISKYTIKIK